MDDSWPKRNGKKFGLSKVLFGVWVAVWGGMGGPVWGDTGSSSSAGKTNYHLFNPTPRDLMRPLSADRPDGTESPYTVDAGHVQVELSFFEYTRNKEAGERVEAWSVFNTNLKVGLTNNTDLQFVFDAYSKEETDPAIGPDTTAEGFGDVQLRLKMNLWGNDGGETSFAVMPYIKIPTDTDLSNGHVEGGLIHMLAWNVDENWSLGFMVEFDAVYDDTDGNYDMESVHTAVLGADLVGKLGGYLEYIGITSTDSDSDYQAILSTGLTYALRPDVVLDIGTRIGLTQAAEDVAIFSGLTWRY